MKLLLAGYFGCGNIGDEAILGALIAGIKQKHPDADITVLSADKEDTTTTYHVSTIPKYSFIDIIRAMRRTDAFILGGGGLLQDSTSGRSLGYYLFLIKLAKFFGKKVILLGQGIGPVNNLRALKRALMNVDLITVRDEDSLELLKELGVRAGKIALSADLTFLMPYPEKEDAKRLLDIEGVVKCKLRLVGVALRDIRRANAEEKYRAIAAMCDDLIRNGDSQLIFLIFKYPDDLEVTSKVMGYMKYPAYVMLRRCMPSEMLAVISQLDALIGMRLHSLIFSAITGVPSFGLSYDPKVANFQDIAGRPWMDITNIADRIPTADILKAFDMPVSEKFVTANHVMRAEADLERLNLCLDDKKKKILGIGVDDVTMDGAVKKIEEFIRSGGKHLIVTPNPEMIMAAQNDMELLDIVNSASLAPADGVGLMIAGRILHKRFKERTPGIDILLNIAKISKSRGYKLFLMGGSEGVAEKAAAKLNANVVGTMQGFSKNDQMMIDAINSSKADVLFVGMGSPRQEKWAAKHLKDLNVSVVMCIGGSLDVISGKAKRAPKIMRKAGLEWFWRLITEPRRWRRMLKLPVFIVRVVLSKYGR